MKSPISAAEAQHYLWGEGCDGWRLLQRGDFSVIQERVPPGKGETAHHHIAARQFFFILTGEAVIWLEGDEVELAAGEGLEIEPGMRHRFFNRSSADVHFLVVSVPSAHGDRVNS